MELTKTRPAKAYIGMMNSYIWKNATLRLLLAAAVMLVPSLAQADQLLHGTPIGTTAIQYETLEPSDTENTIHNVFDGDYDTFFAAYDRSGGWVGLDLGRQYVITRIYFCPRADMADCMTLGIFEGANNADFSDAIPIHMIKSTPREGMKNIVRPKCSRGFRYVRYIGPHDMRCNIAEIRFYGDLGEGDDSQLYQLTNVPTITIHTENAEDVIIKEKYLKGIITIISDEGTGVITDSLEIRGRGNGSWTFEKKPYKIKLNSKKRICGLPAKARKWTLINNCQDKTLIRNLVAFEMCRKMDFAYTPAGTPVDVILNGEYKGNYQLCDQIEVRKNRVDITEMTTKDNYNPNVHGGYLLEIVNKAVGEPVHFISGKFNSPVTVKYPGEDSITTSQKNYIETHYNNMETRVFFSTPTSETRGIPSIMDVESFLKRFLVSEATANIDAYYSVYLTKDRYSKFYWGPMWDFDHAFDNDSRCYPSNNINGYLCLSDQCSTVPGMKQIIQRVIEAFPDSLRFIWSKARLIDGFTSDHFDRYIDSLAVIMDQTQELNFMRWDMLNAWLPYTTGIRGSYQGEIDFLKTTIAERLEWMDRRIGIDSTLLAVSSPSITSVRIKGSKGCILIQGLHGNETIGVYALDGQATLAPKDTESHSNRISVAPGIYIVKVTAPNKPVATKKVVVT